MAIDHLTIQEGTLKVSGDKIDAANLALLPSGVSEESARGAMAKSGRESLIEIGARLECTTLDTKAYFDIAISFDLVDPHKLMNTPTLRHLSAADESPRFIAGVIIEFAYLSIQPLLPRCHGLRILLSLKPKRGILVRAARDPKRPDRG